MPHNQSKQNPKPLPSALLVVLVFTTSAVAQMPGPPRPVSERPARVQYISGQVSVAPKDTNEWSAARLNQSLRSGQHIWSDKDSRVEINVGDGFIRMNSEASVTLVAVNRSTVQIGVNQGEVSLTVLHLVPGEIYEIDTPNATLTATKAGVYRVEVRPTLDQTVVTTRKGSIVATGQGKAVTVSSGQQLVFLNKNSLQHTVAKAPPPDGFEDWASVRDKRLRDSRPPFAVGVGVGPWPYGAVAVPGPPPPPPPYYR
jgi:ferric-dicitrate binding protein FerR (iron transport regulator)